MMLVEFEKICPHKSFENKQFAKKIPQNLHLKLLYFKLHLLRYFFILFNLLKLSESF